MRDEVMRLVTAQMAEVKRREDKTVRQVMRAYIEALNDIRARVQARLDTLGDSPTPSQIRSMGNDVMLTRAIEARLAVLQGEFTAIFREVMPEMARRGALAGSSEVLAIASALGVELFDFAVNPLLEPVVEATLALVPEEVARFRSLILAELRTGLSGGEAIPTLMRRIFQRVPVDGRSSVFKRGMVSAELLTRRAVIQASNNAKAIYLEQAVEQVPELKKQAVASINGRTSDTCLRVHGQVQNVGDPFELAERRGLHER